MVLHFANDVHHKLKNIYIIVLRQGAETNISGTQRLIPEQVKPELSARLDSTSGT